MKKHLSFLLIIFSVLLLSLVLFLKPSPVFAKNVSIITGTGSGGGPQVRNFNLEGEVSGVSFFAYDENFRGGVKVAIGDVNGDGKNEIVAGAGEGGGPHIRIFDLEGNLLNQFFAYHPDFRGGVNVALGDINGDNVKEIIAGAGVGGGPHIRVFDYKENLLLQFFAYNPNFRGGVNVACGDIDGNGIDEIIAGAGVGGGPHVRVFNQKGKFTGWDMFPFHPDFRGGVTVSAGDTDKDGKDEIGVCQASNGEAWCKVYKYNKTQTVLGEWLAYPRGVECGANIDMADIDGDEKAEVITGTGKGGGPQVRTFEANGNAKDSSFFAYDENFRGGTFVAVVSEKVSLPIIKGLSYIDISSVWDNWDADAEDDGPEVNIFYRNKNKDIIFTGDTKVPITVKAKLYTKVWDDENWDRVKGRLVYSGTFSGDAIIDGSFSPTFRIPKESIAVNSQSDYRYGILEVTITTPGQGKFSAIDDICRLYQ